jgi:hypothetical protein
VPAVIDDRKYFNISLGGILEVWRDRDFELDIEHEITDSTGKRTTVPLKLPISGRPEYPETWNASLLAYNRRIDGFGFEERFRDMKGVMCKGWHRHTWNPVTQDAEGKMLARPSMRGFPGSREFLKRAFKDMKILYLRDDYDDNLNLF